MNSAHGQRDHSILIRGLKNFDVSNSVDRLTEAGASVATLADKGALLFVVRGMSLANEFRLGVTGRQVAFNQDLRALHPHPDVDARYLGRFLKSIEPQILSLTDEASHGTKRLTSDRLADISVPLAPFAEQRRIADILDRADALRAKRRAALALLDTLTQSIFIEMFGDPRINPMGWPQVSLMAVLSMPLRNGLSPSHSGNVVAKVLTLSAVTGKAFDPGAWKTSTFNSRPPIDQAVDSQDLLICRGNGNFDRVGRGFFPTMSMPDVTFPDTMIAARTRSDRLDPQFLQRVWNSDAVRRQIEAAARTTNGTFKVNQSMLEGIEFIAPPLEKQQAFARHTVAIDKLRVAHRASLAEMDALFASLQHRAFRGEL